MPGPAMKKNKRYNISLKERDAISTLSRNIEIVIKEADKGACIVIMNSNFYLNKSEEIINDNASYEKFPSSNDKKIMNNLKKLINKFDNELTEKEINYLTNFEYKTSNVYGLPKIHKSATISNSIKEQQSIIVTVDEPSDLKLRPIIVGPACPTHRLSHFLDIILQPFIYHVHAYV